MLIFYGFTKLIYFRKENFFVKLYLDKTYLNSKCKKEILHLLKHQGYLLIK